MSILFEALSDQDIVSWNQNIFLWKSCALKQFGGKCSYIVTLNMLGKTFSRRHIRILILFFFFQKIGIYGWSLCFHFYCITEGWSWDYMTAPSFTDGCNLTINICVSGRKWPIQFVYVFICVSLWCLRDEVEDLDADRTCFLFGSASE